MTIMDPIADMFTRIRNAQQAEHQDAIIPFSKIKLSIVKLLKEEGFIKYYDVNNEALDRKAIKIILKYCDDNKPMISKIKRVSRVGNRVYVKKKDVPKVLNGFGISILSTSKGLLTGRAARLNNVGGELIGIVY